MKGARGRVSSIATKEMIKEVHDMYITAAQSSPEGNIDADVQVIASHPSTDVADLVPWVGNTKY